MMENMVMLVGKQMKQKILPENGYCPANSLLRGSIMTGILLLILSGCLSVSGTGTDGRSMSWEEYNTGMSRAKSENLPVMIYFFEDNSQCYKMDTETWIHDDVVEVSKEFICIKVVRKDENRHIIDEYGIDHYPSVVFLDQAGMEAERVIGYRSPNNLLKDISSLDSEKEPIIHETLTVLIVAIIVTILITIVLYIHHVKKKSER